MQQLVAGLVGRSVISVAQASDTRSPSMPSRHTSAWSFGPEVRTRPISPHGLRRTSCTTGLVAGIGIRDMQYAMRHADPRTTMRYDMARANLDRHAAHAVAAYLAGMSTGSHPMRWRRPNGAGTMRGRYAWRHNSRAEPRRSATMRGMRAAPETTPRKDRAEGCRLRSHQPWLRRNQDAGPAR
jgi:hypothetical protein